MQEISQTVKCLRSPPHVSETQADILDQVDSKLEWLDEEIAMLLSCHHPDVGAC